jgi:hypothetical protein
MAIGEGTKIDNLVQVGHNLQQYGRELGTPARALETARSTAANEELLHGRSVDHARGG